MALEDCTILQLLITLELNISLETLCWWKAETTLTATLTAEWRNEWRHCVCRRDSGVHWASGMRRHIRNKSWWPWRCPSSHRHSKERKTLELSFWKLNYMNVGDKLQMNFWIVIIILLEKMRTFHIIILRIIFPFSLKFKYWKTTHLSLHYTSCCWTGFNISVSQWKV